VLEVYRYTESFPQREIYGLVQQMRKAAVSIPANVAEGFKVEARPTKRDS
jgi:four helix bundle protein